MVNEGFWWLVLLSSSSNKSMISVWSSLIFMVCEKQFSVLCHNKSMLYKRCTKQMLLEPSMHRSHWKSFTSPKSVYTVSTRTLGLAPAWYRFTQTHFCTFVSSSCPPTEQLAPQYQPTPRPSQFPQIWHMMSCVGQHMDATFSLSQLFIVRGHLHVIFWLTSLQTYVIVESQRILTIKFMYIFLVILFSFVILTISNCF